MFRIAICDDEMMICSMIERVILDYQKFYPDEIEVDSYISGEELCSEIEKNNELYDLIFMDVELENLSGIAAAKFIREEVKNYYTKIVFISGMDGYFRDMIDVQPMGFIHKPLEVEKIIEMVALAVDMTNKGDYVFEYKKEHNMHKQQIRDILYFEAENRVVHMITTFGRISFYGTLAEVFKKVEHHHFFFCHKSFLVNNAHIKEIKTKMIRMSNNETLPVGRKNKDILKIQYEFEKGED